MTRAKHRRDKRTGSETQPRGDTWVGRRPAVYKDRKKEQNKQGEARRPKHRKDYTTEE